MLPFGEKLRVRNFVVLKYTKTLRSSELKTLRNQQGIPADVQKHLKRGGLPYIKVETIAADWSTEFVCASTMYNFIDSRPIIEEKNELTEESVTSLHNLFVLMYADCTILGDTEWFEAKANALSEYMARKKVTSNTMPQSETAEEKAEDDKVLEELKTEEEAKAAVENIAHEIENADDGKQ